MPDSSRFSLPRKAAAAWEDDEELAERMRAKFQPAEAGETGVKRAGEEGGSDDDEDLYGDFEDLELGKVFKGFVLFRFP